MKRDEFLLLLKNRLSGLPREDIEERLAFYREMIDDRMEEGLSEEAAVSQIGNVEEISSQIIAETPLPKLVKENIKPKKRLKVWEIVLLAVGSPLWLSLPIAAFAVALSLYAVLWAAVISLWAVFASLGGCALGCVTAGVAFACSGDVSQGVVMIGAGLICAGLSVYLFYGCKAATKGIVWITKKMPVGIKHCFIKKEVHHE